MLNSMGRRYFSLRNLQSVYQSLVFVKIDRYKLAGECSLKHTGSYTCLILEKIAFLIGCNKL